MKKKTRKGSGMVDAEAKPEVVETPDISEEAAPVLAPKEEEPAPAPKPKVATYNFSEAVQFFNMNKYLVTVLSQRLRIIAGINSSEKRPAEFWLDLMK